MNYRNIEANANPSSIGRKVAMLRHAMDCTQAEFAESTLMSRGSLAKLETTENDNDIGYEMLFRLFYITNRIYTNIDDSYIKKLAYEIMNSVISIIEH